VLIGSYVCDRQGQRRFDVKDVHPATSDIYSAVVLAWLGVMHVKCRWGIFGMSTEASPPPREIGGR
jgi:hypothetical protein